VVFLVDPKIQLKLYAHSWRYNRIGVCLRAEVDLVSSIIQPVNSDSVCICAFATNSVHGSSSAFTTARCSHSINSYALLSTFAVRVFLKLTNLVLGSWFMTCDPVGKFICVTTRVTITSSCVTRDSVFVSVAEHVSRRVHNGEDVCRYRASEPRAGSPRTVKMGEQRTCIFIAEQ
jgi:hypothetical protein